MKKLLLSIFLIMLIFGGAVSYAASYNLEINNGIASTSGLVNEGEFIEAIAAPKEGYKLARWTAIGIELSESEAESTYISFIMPNNSVSIKAVFEPKAYNVIYKANGGIGAMEIQSFSYNETKNLLTNKFTREGYVFSCWNTNANGTGQSYNDGASFTPTEKTTLYAQWNIVPYKLTIHNGTSSTERTETVDTQITISATPSNGQNFVKWSVEGITITEEEKVNSILSFKMPGNNVVVTAIFDAQTYNVTYDKNGGTGIMDTQVFTYNIPQKLATNKYTKQGYNFSGWNTKADGSGTNYTNQANYTATEDITLYAIWTPATNIPYTIYHYFENADNNGYSIYKTENKFGTTGETINFSNNIITILGGTYNRGTLTANGTPVESTTVNGDGSTEIYLWYVRDTFTLTLDKNEHIDNVIGAGTYKYEQTVTIEAILKNEPGFSYKWINWTSNDTSLLTNQSERKATFTMPNGSVTLKANGIREEIKYTVTYDSNGGTGFMDVQIFNQDKAQNLTPNLFVKTNYSFVGWSTTKNGGVQYINGANYVAREDITLYAIWEMNEHYTLTVINNEVSMERIAFVNEYIQIKAKPLDGYYFKDWTYNGIELDNSTIPEFNFVMPKNDVKIVANFGQINRYNITWSTADNKLTKKLDVKTIGSGVIDWGDGTTSVIPNTVTKQTISHTYASAGTYNISIPEDVITYLNVSDNVATNIDVSKSEQLKEIFAYNNNIETLTLGTALENVVIDEDTNVVGTADRILKIGVEGPGNFIVNDNLLVSFTSQSLSEIKTMKLNGNNIAVQNPYNASGLNGQNTLVANFGAEGLSWVWSVTDSTTRTIRVEVESDTTIYWGDGETTQVQAGGVREISHIYSTVGTYNVGFSAGVISKLDVSNSKITSIDVSHNLLLTELNVSGNDIGKLNVASNALLKSLLANRTNLYNIDLSKNTLLEKVELIGNNLETININTSASLNYLDVSNNRIPTLNVSSYTSLKTLKCSNNGLTTLNLGNTRSLLVLDVSNNVLTNLDITKNVSLEELYCNYNELSSLNVASNTELKILKCENNEITSLTVTNLTNLEEIRTFNNNISTLNLANNIKLNLAIVDNVSTISGSSGKNILRVEAKENGYIDVYDYITARFIPERGYQIQKITLNDVDQEINESLTLSDINGDNTLIVWFNSASVTSNQEIGNIPKLLDGMIPVKWNGANWIITIQGDSDWYDYSSSEMKWANVMLRDGTKYINESGVSTIVGNLSLRELNGMQVDSSNIGSMFVWIPRYTYLIEGSNISIRFSNGTQDNTKDNYILHPAFNFASYNGGDPSKVANYEPKVTTDYMLTGFWAAKYPASPVTSSGNTVGKIAVKGGTEWTGISIDNAFVNSKEMFRNNLDYYGIKGDSSNLYNSHLMKNVEWGAVAYLTKAIGNVNTSSTTNNKTGVYGLNTGSEFVASYVELVGGISNYSVREYGIKLLDYNVKTENYSYEAEPGNVRYVDKVKIMSPEDSQSTNLKRLEDYFGTATTTTEVTGSLINGIVPYKEQAFFIRGNTSMFNYGGVTGAPSSSISFRPVLITEVPISALNIHTITASVTTRGKITPSGTISVIDGGSSVYKITPNAGCEIVDVLVDGVSVIDKLVTVSGTTKSYTFVNVTEDHVIYAICDLPILDYNVSASMVYSGTDTIIPNIYVDGTGTHSSRSTVTLNASKNGYTFDGWTIVGNSVTLRDLTLPKISFIMPSNNVVLKAKQILNTYTIEYDLKCDHCNVAGTVTGNPSTYTVEDTFTLKNPELLGHTFDGWTGTGLSSKTKNVNISGDYVHKNYKANYIVNDYTLTVVSDTTSNTYTQKYGTTKSVSVPSESYTITYNYNGSGTANTEVTTVRDFSKWELSGNGNISSNTANPTTYTYGAGNDTLRAIHNQIANEVTLPNPSRTGYTLDGWYTSGGTKVGNGGDPYAPSSNIMLYAHWTPITYTITYNLSCAVCGTTGSISGHKTSYNIETATFTLPEPSLYGHTFAGWTGSNGTTKQTSVTISRGSYENKTYTANWTPIDYTISYNLTSSCCSKNGTVGTANYPTYNMHTETFTLNNPTLSGHTFTGWTGTNGNTPQTSITIAKGSSGNRSYTANYSVETYTISYTLNGGSASNKTSYTVHDSNFTLNNPSKTGYTFTGWTGSNGTTKQTSVTVDTSKAENQSYTANYSINQYTITFYVDGTVYKTITQNYGTEITAPSNPSKTGYTFTGWDKTIPSTMPASNMDINAKFSINQYTITFYVDGAVYKTITQNYGTAITAPSNPSKTGYTFNGWDKTIPGTMPAYNMIINAQFGTNNYTVTVTANPTAGGSVTGSGTTYHYNDTVTITTTVNTGYRFTGWTVESGGVSLSSTSSTTATFKMPSGNVSVKANFALYGDADNNGVVNMNDVTVLNKYVAGQAVEINKANSDVFVNGEMDIFDVRIILRYVSKATTEIILHTCGDYTISYNPIDEYGHKKVYACICGGMSWSEDEEHTFVNNKCSLCGALNSVTVTFNANNGSGVMEQQLINPGGTINSNTFIAPDSYYEFHSWNTVANGTGSSYANGATATFTQNTTLYAQWYHEFTTGLTCGNCNGSGKVCNRCGGDGKIEYNCVDPEYEHTTSTCDDCGKKIDEYTCESCGDSVEDYHRTYGSSGCYHTNYYEFDIKHVRNCYSCDDCFYCNGTGKVATCIHGQTSSHYYVASSNPIISFYGNGGSGVMSPQMVLSGAATKINSNEFSSPANGYSFKNWNTAANGSGTSYENGGFVTTSSDITLYARWYCDGTESDCSNCGGDGYLSDGIYCGEGTVTSESPYSWDGTIIGSHKTSYSMSTNTLTYLCGYSKRRYYKCTGCGNVERWDSYCATCDEWVSYGCEYVQNFWVGDKHYQNSSCSVCGGIESCMHGKTGGHYYGN